MKRYSIAEARNNFTSLVHAAEAGAPVALTRRGKPIAVLLALKEYERLKDRKRAFKAIHEAFRRRNPDLAERGIEPEEWLRDVRDSSPGRDFTW